MSELCKYYIEESFSDKEERNISTIEFSNIDKENKFLQGKLIILQSDFYSHHSHEIVLLINVSLETQVALSNVQTSGLIVLSNISCS